MNTRTLACGVVEAYNEHLRIRLQLLPDRATALVTIFQLKPNGFHYRKIYLRVAYPVSLSELVNTYQTLVA